MSDFKSGFANDLSSMIELKVSLGGSADTYLLRAAAFDTFCFEKHKMANGLSKAKGKTTKIRRRCTREVL